MDGTEKKRAFIIKFLYFAICILLCYAAVKYVMPVLMPFVIGFLIAFILKPLTNLIARKTKWNRKVVAVLLVTLVYLVVGTLLVILFIRVGGFLGGWFANLPKFYRETLDPAFASISKSFNEFVEKIDPTFLQALNAANQNISSYIMNIINSVSSSVGSFITGVAGSLPWIVAASVLSIISSYFFTADYYRITTFIVRQLPQRGQHLLFKIKDFTVNTLFRFGRAYAILISITFCEVLIGLLILRVPYAPLIALVTAIVDILPVFGTGTIMIPWALYSLFSGNVGRGIGLAILYVAITVIRQIIEPRIVGHQIGLYPLLTLICMFVGVQLFGFWGLFGLPVLLVILIYLNREGEITLFKGV